MLLFFQAYLPVDLLAITVLEKYKEWHNTQVEILKYIKEASIDNE